MAKLDAATASAPTKRSTAPEWLQAMLGIGASDPGPRFAWYGRIAFACSLITLMTVACGVWIFTSGPPRIDFLSFWAAGHLVLNGQPSLAYNYQLHRAVEETVTVMAGPMPFPYPPPFLFAVTPFGFRPVWLAYLLWVCITGGLYLAAFWRRLPATYALSHPAAFMNAIGGQNGFLTCSILVAGAAEVERRPFRAGLIFGLLVCKPQIGVLIPVALLAGRHWRAIAGAAAAATALLISAALLFGIDSYTGFLAMAGQFTRYMSASAWRWNQFSSVFGLSRSLGASQPISLALQLMAAGLAAIVTWRAWAQKLDERFAILATATLLVSPYLFTYDTLLLVIPMASLLRDPRRPWRVAVVWLLSALAVLAALGLTSVAIPNITPLTAALVLWWLTGGIQLRAIGSRLPWRAQSSVG